MSTASITHCGCHAEQTNMAIHGLAGPVMCLSLAVAGRVAIYASNRFLNGSNCDLVGSK